MEKENPDKGKGPMYFVIALVIIIVVFALAGSDSNNQQQNTVASNTFFVNGEVNVRKCAAITCDPYGKYSFDGGFALPYENISDLPDWVEVKFKNTSTGEDIDGYISKSLFSLNQNVAKNSAGQNPQQQQPSDQAQNQTKKDLPSIIKEWNKSTAYVEYYWINPNTHIWFLKESGSGLLAMFDGVPTVITNKHIVYDMQQYNGFANECDVAFPNDNGVYYSVVTATGGQVSTTADGSDVAYISGLKELALGNKTPSISLNNRARGDHFFCDNNPPMGEPLVILGYPVYGTNAGTFMNVFSTINPTATEGIISGQDGIYLTTSAKIDHGNSGGLAIDENNDCYIGIPSASYTGSIESLGRILPASYAVK